jgi:hypothetical protein
MKNIIICLLFLTVLSSYSQKKVNINAIINRPVKIDIPKKEYNYTEKITINNTVPIYQQPEKNLQNDYIISDLLQGLLIRQTFPYSKSKLDLTPVRFLPQLIENNEIPINNKQ